MAHCLTKHKIAKNAIYTLQKLTNFAHNAGMRNIELLEPARSIIIPLGGPTYIASRTNSSVSTVSRWGKPRSDGGSDGYIPLKRYPALKKIAEDKGIDLEIEHLVTGLPSQ